MVFLLIKHETTDWRPLTFESGAETVYNAGYTVKCYLSGGAPNTYPWFANFKSTSILPPALLNNILLNGTLFGDGTPGGIGNPLSPTPESVKNMAFEEDCANGVLPDVSFLGTLASEHPPALPAAGANFLAQILDALAANEDLWNTTLFVLDYDENDGFFDHVPPPSPDKAEFPEEFVTKASAAGTPGGDRPVGAGFRVPCFAISPWSTDALTGVELVGVVPSKTWRRWRRPAIVVICAVAAVITPSSDPFSFMAMAIPMLLFYEGSILLGRAMGKKASTPRP